MTPVLAAAITTCARPQDKHHQLLPLCVDSLLSGGFQHFVLNVEKTDGDTGHEALKETQSLLQEYCVEYQVYRHNESRIGPVANFLSVIERCTRSSTPYTHILYSQDDVQHSSGLHDWLVKELQAVAEVEASLPIAEMYQHPLSAPAITSLWIPEAYRGHTGWWENPIEGNQRYAAGALCYFATKRVWRSLVADPGPLRGSRTGLERRLLHWCQINNIPYWNPPISYVRNLGEGWSTLDAPQSTDDPLKLRTNSEWQSDLINHPFIRSTEPRNTKPRSPDAPLA